MKSGKPQATPLLMERYELKYTIPPSLIRPIADFVAVCCKKEPHSQASATGFYRVNNIYMDTPGYLFLRMRREGAEKRFNMRIRSYGDTPGLPYFLEIKQKWNQVIKKYRARVTDRNWYRAYTQPGYRIMESDTDEQEIRNRQRFERMVYTYNAQPKIFTQYRRLAWVSEVDTYARVTFDVNLRYMTIDGYHPVPREHDLISCDSETCFDPGCSVILELKCYAAAVPFWMIDLIRHFQLRRRSFSKYLNGVQALFGNGGGDGLSRVPVF
ncbi:hypothetical protein Dvar_27570 [Desulfosarcina variabilis str. Montpellier]|uniref:VTC domain-containing protein n=1 Tax=Desulfosarcina variabilis TaxID=2300 RepID=UPI003AFB169C